QHWQEQQQYPAQPQRVQVDDVRARRMRRARRLFFAAACILLGATVGIRISYLVNGIPPAALRDAAPGTPAERRIQQHWRSRVEKQLPQLRAMDADPEWESWDAYDTLSPEHKAQHMTAGALGGVTGVGLCQRVYHHKPTGQLVSVIVFGPATTGWPATVHGGLLATILDESCGRAAFKQWGGASGMTAKLDLTYRTRTKIGAPYLILVAPRPDEKLPESERGKRHYKCWVDAEIRDADGRVCVTANALFIRSKGRN
ncbi:putative mitochondrial membrane protein FMP10, partial [Diplogelasinospora grovesii]